MKKFNVRALKLSLFFFLGISSLLGQVNYTANDFVLPYNNGFHYGVNMGGYGTSSNISPSNGLPLPWTDDDLAALAIGDPSSNVPGAGATSIRLALPESFLEDPNLSYDIRLNEFQRYVELGLKDHTVFLNSPSDAHRDYTEYCPGTPSEIFRNLHLPIWDGGANGTPYTDENYYARYVYEVVIRYGKWVKYWEVWNEPDFTTATNNTATPGTPGSWWTEDPSPCDLNGQFGISAPISHYVRMLRITYEVVKSLYPESYVCTGGIGYPSFLDAILRNTDNPNNGDVSSEYPLKGGAYFDVLSWHYYPHVDEAFKDWNNDRQDFDYSRHSDAAITEFFEREKEFRSVLESRGYNGNTFPKKLQINTETNLPRKELLSYNFAGGNQLQANYNMKVMFASQVAGLDHLHLYHIGEKYDDALTVFAPQQQWDLMGLYKNLLTQNKQTAIHTDGGIALKTMSDALKGYWYDAGKTNQLQLPNNVRGGAFTNGAGETTYMLWAKTFRDRSEEAFASYTFPNNLPWTVIGSATLAKKQWNHFRTGVITSVSSSNVALTGNPVFLKVDNTVSPCDGLTVSVNSQPPTCFGYTNGTIAINTFNGVAPYTYLWEDNSTSPLRNNLVQGTYYVTVSDGAGCSIIQNIQLDAPSPMNATIQIRNESIAGLKDGQLTAFASGGSPGYTYTWSNGANGQSIQGLAAGTYSLTVNDTKGCPVIKQAIVEADDIGCGTFRVNTWKTDLSCFNSNDGTLSANPSGGTGDISFQWNTGEVTGFIQNLAPGTYRLTATDELGCQATATSVITSPAQLSLFVSSSNVTFTGAEDGSASAFVNGGTPPYTYEWNNLDTSPTITNLEPALYSVTVTDDNGCQAINQTEVISLEPDCESFFLDMPFGDPGCPGANTGYVSASPQNGLGPYQFRWNTGAQTQTIGNLPAGTYFVTVTDMNGCVAQRAQTLTPKAPITVSENVTPSSAANNADGAVDLQVNGGTSPYRAAWSNGMFGLSVTNISSGAYYVTVTDSNDCNKVIQVIVEANSEDCSSFTGVSWQSENVSCTNQNDGAIILLPQGGQSPFRYAWSNGANTQGISNLFAGNYTVTVTDANDCQRVRTVGITQPSALTGTINSILSGDCGDIVDMRAIGIGGTPPYTYLWSNGFGGQNLINQGSGYYTVTITDANNCTFVQEFDFAETNGFPAVNDAEDAVGEVLCYEEMNGYVDLEVLTGLAPYTYNWSNGSNNQDIGSIGAGVYIVTVTDANGCESEHSFIVSEPAPVELDFDVLSPTSQNENGSIRVEAFGGSGNYSYLWDFGANTAVINNVNPGTYSVTVTDENGCYASGEVDLSISTSIEQNSIRDKSILLYPNPSEDFFFIELPQGELNPTTITLFDIHGKMISQNNYSQQENLIRMEVANLASGTYMVQLQFEDGYSLAKRVVLF